MHPCIVIAGLEISSWYFLLFSAAIISTALFIYLRPSTFIISRPSMLALSVMLFIASFIGGRISFFLVNMPHRGLTFSSLVLFDSGFVFYGAFMASVLATYAYSAITKNKFLAVADYGAPFFLLAQAFVRLGCFMAGCCYGKPVDRPFGVVFKQLGDLPRYPVQCYEALALFAIYIITRGVYKRDSGVLGKTSFIALFLYAVERFFMDFFRADSFSLFMNITFMQVVCLILMIVSIRWLIGVGRSKNE